MAWLGNLARILFAKRRLGEGGGAERVLGLLPGLLVLKMRCEQPAQNEMRLRTSKCHTPAYYK